MEQAIEHFSAAEAWQELIQAHEPVKMFYIARMNWGDARGCEKICQRMLEAARSTADAYEEAKWLHDQAVLNHNMGNYTLAEQTCLQGLEIAHRTGQEVLQSALLDRLGLLMQDQGEYERARGYYDQSMRLKEKLSLSEAIASLRSQYAELLENEGYLGQALEIQKDILKSSNTMDILRFGRRLTRILRKQGNYAEAEMWCVKAMNVARQLGYQLYLVRILLEAAHVALSMKEYNKAYEFLAECREIADYPRHQVRLFHLFGTLQHLLGNLAEAECYYKDALSLDFPFMNYNCAVKLGILCLEKKEVEEAQVYLKRGIFLCHVLLEKTPRLYDAIYHLALAQLGSGQTSDALATYRRALEVCSAKGVVEEVIWHLQLLQRTATGERIKPALTLLEEALSASEIYR